jgi:hypothetical protein
MKNTLVILMMLLLCCCVKNFTGPTENMQKPLIEIVDLNTQKVTCSLFCTEDAAFHTADSLAELNSSAHLDVVRMSDNQSLYEINNNSVAVEDDDNGQDDE